MMPPITKPTLDNVKDQLLSAFSDIANLGHQEAYDLSVKVTDTADQLIAQYGGSPNFDRLMKETLLQLQADSAISLLIVEDAAKERIRGIAIGVIRTLLAVAIPPP
jgi:hypothetical protein